MGGEGGSAEEGLSYEEVVRVIQAHHSEVKHCYETALVRRPDTKGQIHVNFKIGANGSVTTSGIRTSTMNDDSVGQCVLSRLKKWRFPTPKGNKDVGVAYPFIFKAI